MGESHYYPGLLVANEKYRLLSYLGQGGMGEVWEAIDQTTGRHVALKFLPSDKAVDERRRQRLLREARCAIVRHEHVVDVKTVEKLDNGVEFIVMELLQGKTLRQVIQEQGRLPVARATNIMLQIVSALGAIHHAGIVHRDLKPSNIFLVTRGTNEDYVKVLDFGIAKVMAPSNVGMAQDTLTQPGDRCGTQGYMAPEHLVNPHGVTYQADIFALGIMYYECLTGHPTWTERDQNTPFLDDLPEDLPSPLRQLIHAALKLDPEARISLAEMFALLSPFASLKVPPLPSTPPPMAHESSPRETANGSTKTNSTLTSKTKAAPASAPHSARANLNDSRPSRSVDQPRPSHQKMTNSIPTKRPTIKETPTDLEKLVGHLASILLLLALFWVGLAKAPGSPKPSGTPRVNEKASESPQSTFKTIQESNPY